MVSGPETAISTEGAALRVKNVCKEFASHHDPKSTVMALRDMSMLVSPGELISLVGPSGCGKSTLLRLVAGLDTPSSGELWAGSERITGPGAERGLVFQDPNLFPWLTVRGNIQAGLVARGVLRQRRHEVDEYLRLVGLEPFANAYPHHLSGMAQRVALARALINHPRILLLDEPLGALDAFTRMRMQDEVLRLWQARRTTMLLVTHDIDEAIYMSDRIAIITPRPGRVDRMIPVSLPRPRQRNSPEFLQLRAEILELLHFAGAQPPAGSSGPDRAGDNPSPDPVAISSRSFSSIEPGQDNLDFPVAIIGGGPAGSTLGAYLSRAGIPHIILEQAIHPRRHVGESLVCSTTPIFQEIDFLPVMEREAFPRKYGAVWTHWAGERQHIVRFREIPELGLTQDYTYHVDRSRFDQLLLQHAARQGSTVLEGARVEQVEFDSHGAVSAVRFRHNGAERRVRCRIAVDASGRGTVIGSQLRLKRHDALFDQFAVHNWFEGVDRGAVETADYIHLHLLSLPRAWVWIIPISRTVTSVGIVTRSGDFPKGGESVEDFFARHIASHPLLARRMANARPLHAFTKEANYSYVMDRFAGDGWLLVGDAARFLDPVFSSGVSVAMESARLAAAGIVDALKRNDVRAASFAEYERRLRTGADIWREFILLFYQLPPMFLELLSQPDARAQITQLLQGNVYDRASVPILEEMRTTVDRVAADPAHPWRAQLSEDLLSRSA